jgi:hypothetical protein
MRSQRQLLYISVVITVLLMMTTINTPVTATEPSAIQLTYDFGAQKLTVNVSHYVANTKTHYIENIEVFRNDVSVLNQSYVNQSFNYGMIDSFSVTAAVDDNLTVTALCSKGYTLTRWLIVTSTTATNTQPETTPTTTPTNTPPPSESSLGPMVATIAAVGVVLFLVLFFWWLEPDRFSSFFKNLGSRIRSAFTWTAEKVSHLFETAKTKLPSR